MPVSLSSVVFSNRTAEQLNFVFFRQWKNCKAWVWRATRLRFVSQSRSIRREGGNRWSGKWTECKEIVVLCFCKLKSHFVKVSIQNFNLQGRWWRHGLPVWWPRNGSTAGSRAWWIRWPHGRVWLRWWLRLRGRLRWRVFWLGIRRLRRIWRRLRQLLFNAQRWIQEPDGRTRVTITSRCLFILYR